jgi:hypothetical protein
MLPIPFTISKLKQRHHRLLKNLNPWYVHNESEGRCSSIDSDAYKQENELSPQAMLRKKRQETFLKREITTK